MKRKVRRKVRTLREARSVLRSPRTRRIIWTQKAQEEAFEKFWLAKPTVDEFKSYMTGHILTAHAIYFMATHPFTPIK